MLSLAYIGVRLRDLCSIINRFEVEDTHLEQLQQLAKKYYRANALLLPTSVNPTIWTISHVVAAHARQVHDKYGQGLLTVTMEGKKAKHIALQKLSANTTYQHRWAEIFRHEFILCWFGYLNSIMNLVLTLLVKMFTFLKGFLMTVTTATVDYIKPIPLIRAAVYVVIISWH